MNDPRTTSAGEFHIGPPNYSEVGAVNPLHAVFMILIFIISVLLYKKSGKLNFLYVLSVLLTLITFSYLFKWQVFSSRYHLPLFVLFAPSFGYVLTRLIHRPTLNLIFGLLFLVTSTSWLFNIDARPLIPNSKSNLTVKSLFNDSRENWYFVSIASLDRYSMITTRIQEENCHNVGIMVSGAGAEYPFWVLLGMPRQDMRIEWDVVGTPSERYRDASFEPCAVICEDCPADWDSFKNKPKVIDNGYFQLFMRE